MGCKRCLEPGGVTEALGLTVVGHREDFTRGSKCFYVELQGQAPAHCGPPGGQPEGHRDA